MDSSARKARAQALLSRETGAQVRSKAELLIAHELMAKHGDARTKETGGVNALITRLVKQHFATGGTGGLDARVEKEAAAFRARASSSSRGGGALPTATSKRARNRTPAQTLTLPRMPQPQTSSASSSQQQLGTGGRVPSLDAVVSGLASDWSLIDALNQLEHQESQEKARTAKAARGKAMAEDLAAEVATKQARRRQALAEERGAVERAAADHAAAAASEQAARARRVVATRAELDKAAAFARATMEAAAVAARQAELEERVEMKRLKQQGVDAAAAKQGLMANARARQEKVLAEALGEKRARASEEAARGLTDLAQLQAAQARMAQLEDLQLRERKERLARAVDAANVHLEDLAAQGLEIMQDTLTGSSAQAAESRVARQAQEVLAKEDARKAAEAAHVAREQATIASLNGSLVACRLRAKELEAKEKADSRAELASQHADLVASDGRRQALEAERVSAHTRALAEQVAAAKASGGGTFNMSTVERAMNEDRLRRFAEVASRREAQVIEVLQHFPKKGAKHSSL
jgi:hypothetical protein